MPLDGNVDEVIAELKSAQEDFQKAATEVRSFGEKAKEEIKNAAAMTAETRTAMDETIVKMGEVSVRLAELEQKNARRGATGEPGTRAKSLGQRVVESEEFKTRLAGKPNARASAAVQVETRALMSGTATWGSTVSATNSLVMPDRQDLTLMLPRRQLMIRDLVAPGNTTSNAVEYAVQVTRTNNAAPVAEGAAKPYSNIAFDLRSFPVRTIAHMFKASRQILDDAPALQSIIDSEGRFGIALVEEAQILYGDGTGQNILGIVPQATAYSAPFTEPTGLTAMDRIRMAMLQAANAFLPVTAHVLHPNDWTQIEMLKDAAGRYIIGDPLGSISPRLWGLPVVPTVALSSGTFLTGSFSQGAQIFDRMAVEVLISSENVDDFEKNLLSIRIEERMAFVVKRPAAFITGNLPT